MYKFKFVYLAKHLKCTPNAKYWLSILFTKRKCGIARKSLAATATAQGAYIVQVYSRIYYINIYDNV